MYNFTITNDNIKVIVKGKVVNVHEGQANFTFLRDALLDKRWDDVPKHLTALESLTDYLSLVSPLFKVEGSRVSYKDDPLPESFTMKIHELVKRGESPVAMLNFHERLQRNPSHRSVNQLWNFLGQLGIPLTEDGCFLAYKKVRDDLFDFHSGTIKNAIGTIVEMPRNKISDDPDHACHEGLHVGALKYARDSFHSGDGQLIIVKVDPENVVSVPHDESCMKMRVCRYEVIGYYSGQPLDNVKHEEDEVYEDDELVIEEGQVKKNKLDDMNLKELLEQPIDKLRKYAGHVLKIVGASKIPGGKSALVKRILKVRK